MNVDQVALENAVVMDEIEEDHPSNEFEKVSLSQIEGAVEKIFENTIETTIKFEYDECFSSEDPNKIEKSLCRKTYISVKQLSSNNEQPKYQIESAVDEIFASAIVTKIKSEKHENPNECGESMSNKTSIETEKWSLINEEPPNIGTEMVNYSFSEPSFEFDGGMLSKVKMEVDELLLDITKTSIFSEGENYDKRISSKRNIEIFLDNEIVRNRVEQDNQYLSTKDPKKIENSISFTTNIETERKLSFDNKELPNVETENDAYLSNELAFEFEEPILSKVTMEVDESFSNSENASIMTEGDLSPSNRTSTKHPNEKLSFDNEEIIHEAENNEYLLNEFSCEYEEPLVSKVKLEVDEMLSNNENAATEAEEQLNTSNGAPKERHVLRELKIVVEKIDKNKAGVHHKCDINEKEVNRNGSSKTHLRMKKGKKPYKRKSGEKSFVNYREKPLKCDVCQKEFNLMGNFNIHLRIHTGENPYACEFCKRKFTQKVNLQAHLRTHTGEKPYKCTVCGAKFTQGSILSMHLLVHTGEKPHRCDICGKTFTQKVHLQAHLRTHTTEKPHKCDICGNKFARVDNLKKHAHIHTGERPYKCKICHKGFSRKDCLKSHARKHTGEKPHKCDTCGKGFTRAGSLKQHANLHTGEKPFKCDLCGKGFARTDSLRGHLREHLKGEA